MLEDNQTEILEEAGSGSAELKQNYWAAIREAVRGSQQDFIFLTDLNECRKAFDDVVRSFQFGLNGYLDLPAESVITVGTGGAHIVHDPEEQKRR